MSSQICRNCTKPASPAATMQKCTKCTADVCRPCSSFCEMCDETLCIDTCGGELVKWKSEPFTFEGRKLYSSCEPCRKAHPEVDPCRSCKGPAYPGTMQWCTKCEGDVCRVCSSFCEMCDGTLCKDTCSGDTIVWEDKPFKFDGRNLYSSCGACRAAHPEVAAGLGQ